MSQLHDVPITTRAYERRSLQLRAYVLDFVEQNNSTTYGESVATMACFYKTLTGGPTAEAARATIAINIPASVAPAATLAAYDQPVADLSSSRILRLL